MSQIDTAHAWWSRLRHQGLLLSPVVMVERFPTAPHAPPFPALPRLREARTRFDSKIEGTKEGDDRDQGAILGFLDSLLENFLGHTGGRIAKQGQFADKFTVPIRIGSRTETIRPHRIVFADEWGSTPALLVMADSSPHVGRGRGRTKYSQMLELLRGSGHRLGLLTNGQQFRLLYAGLDFESWCEWESDRWFDDSEGTEELCGLRQLLLPESLKPVKSGVSGLLDAVEESRKRQADLSSVLRENVRQAVELLLEEVSTANRTNSSLFNELKNHNGDLKLTDAEAHEALLQASVRVVMRLVVCLFAESRQLLPVNDPIFAQSYGVRSLYELLDEVTRYEGGTHALFSRQTAWPRLMALFRLIYGGSAHGAFPMRAYGGVLFRPGDAANSDPVARALHILEHNVTVGDATIYYVLRKLLRGPLPVIKGKSKTFVEGPVDYTDLRTEFIGLIYEGLLDYRIKRTDEHFGPQVFLNLGREPVLPLKRLDDMLSNDKKALKDLFTTLRKEKVTASSATSEENEEEETEEEADQAEEQSAEEVIIEVDADTIEIQRADDYLDAVEAAKRWAREAVVLAGLVRKQGKKESDNQYQQEVESEANRLIKRVVAVGEFYLVRAGNTRKGTGTFYTRPQLAVPTVHRTLEPLCYDKSDDGRLTPKSPEIILGLKVCDPACGSASFSVAALHYLTDALYKSLLYHRQLDDPEKCKQLTLPYGRPRTNVESDHLIPFPPNDPQRGHTFEDRIKALLRRYIVERCIYGVDINPLAVEFARVSLWVETLDPELPFSFLDHKIKVGNSLVGCWLDRVEDYPLKAWEREGGDGKNGPRTQRIEEFLKGKKEGKKRVGDGRIKLEMRQIIESRFSKQAQLFIDEMATTESVVAETRKEYERLHDLPINDPDEREGYYRTHVEHRQPIQTLRRAMDEWCAIWFWPTDEESMRHVPTPLTFHHPSVEKDALVERLTGDVKFFHWEIEYPDVFTPEDCGFDAMLGNPPWENAQPSPYEFFSDYDPIIRTLGRLDLLKRMKELYDDLDGLENRWFDHCGLYKDISNWIANVADPFGLEDDSSGLGRSSHKLISEWKKRRADRPGFVAAERPFRYQVGRVFTYKLFLELSHFLLGNTGRLGLIVPSALYTDSWSLPLRKLFLENAQWEWLFSFENKKKIFDIHTSFKFCAVIVARKKSATAKEPIPLQAAFMIHELSAWDRPDPPVLTFDPGLITLFSPRSKSIPEVRSQNDLEVCRKIYARSFRVGDNPPGWEIDFSLEFMMNTDAKLFPPKERWESTGYRPDRFGRWIGPQGDVALPLYEGRMVGQFDFSKKGWVSGKGRSAIWRDIPFEIKTIEPQFLMAESTYSLRTGSARGLKVAFMDITSSTNSRTTISTPQSEVPCGNSSPVLRIKAGGMEKTLLLSAFMNSLAFDFATRQRTGGNHLNWFIVEECPIPLIDQDIREAQTSRIAFATAQMSLIHPRFALDWLKLKTRYHKLAEREWKHWWAVTEADRLRLRVEIDALCADLYGLEHNDFDWIVRDDPTDPKGFWRVDKQLPFRERLTGLAAAAFRALKDGKWSSESASALTNYEFFDLLGIAELTNADAAKAKGFPGPLIKNRNGCHVWNPESFPADDPRHGWTWDHCYQDAVALLGSEQAVESYLLEMPENTDRSGSANGDSYQLRQDRMNPKQQKITFGE